MPNGAQELHRVLAGLPLQTNAGKRFYRPIPATEQAVTVRCHRDRELWVGGSLFHKGNHR